MNNLINVNCAACNEELEIFDNDEGFDCPYCGAKNIFVEEGAEEEEIVAITATTDDPLVLGRSIIMSWCGKHEEAEATEHAWATDTIIGCRLFCLICWPSRMPKHPIRHIRREK